MNKFLLFNEQATAGSIGDTAHDVYCVPVERFIGFTNEATTSTEVTMFFVGMEEGQGDGDASSVDKVVLTITDNKQVEVMKAIANAITNEDRFGDGLVIIGDANAGTFIHKDVTGVTITVASAD
jgi:hypothetical protein